MCYTYASDISLIIKYHAECAIAIFDFRFAFMISSSGPAAQGSARLQKEKRFRLSIEDSDFGSLIKSGFWLNSRGVCAFLFPFVC
jgi:hypothetical protein